MKNASKFGRIQSRIAFLSVLFLLLFSFPILAVESIQVAASADSYVHDSSTNKGANFGSSEYLEVKGDGSGYIREAYLKFDISSVDISKYNDVKLKLTTRTIGTHANLTQWLVRSSGNNWAESTITWNEKPTAIREIRAIDAITEINTAVYFDISKYALRLLENGATAISVNIATTKPETGDKFNVTFHSKEADNSAYAPTLVFSYVADKVEEPVDEIYETIMGRIRAAQKSNIDISSIDAKTTTNLADVQADGSFADIDYTNQAQTNWPTIAHIDRLKPIVLSYVSASSDYYGDENAYNAIVNILQCWYDKAPKSTNWYMQQIAVPQRLGVMLILMREGKKKLSIDLEDNILDLMFIQRGGAPDQSGSQGTGANKLDIATHWVYRGCLTESKTVLDKGVEQAFYPLFYTTGEGFQHDYSYLQHGQQLYIGGYGDVIAQGICNIAQYVNGTRYELSQEKFGVLFDFMRKTYLPVIRGQYFLYNVAGRSLSRPNAMSKSGFGPAIELLKLSDPANTAEYDAAIKRVTGEKPASYGVNSYHAHYWRSDYTLHQRPGYTMDVRMVSTRTLRNENGNGENIKGYFLSEGAMDIAVEGNEYYNIFPVWDWGRIPGTTSPALTSIPKPGEWGTKGTSTFVGGVSDGKYGVSAFDLINKEHSINTEAKKSWFFFDDEVVCLGAGIKSTNTIQINTTLNQCLLEGDVTVVKTDKSNDVFTTSQLGSRTYDSNASWILHGKVGYYLPNGGNLVVENKEQSGSWQSINTPQSADVIKKNVFKLWLNHGVKPTNGNYAYVIVPNVNTVDKVNNYNKENIAILSNTENIQAVEHKTLGIVSVVFYKSGVFTYRDGVTIKADKSCAVMIKNIETDNVEVYISDPSCSKSSLSLELNLPAFAETKALKCEFPMEKAYLGSTQQYVVDNNTPAVEPDNNIYINVVEDAYVYGGDKSANFGTEKIIYVKTDSDVAYTRAGYLKFDLSNKDLSNIEKVGVRLFVYEGDIDYLNNTMILKACDASWSETAITWNNKPTAEITVASAPAVSIQESLSFDVTDYAFQEKAKGNNTLSFALTNTYTGSVSKTRIGFYAKESLAKDSIPQIFLTPEKVISNVVEKQQCTALDLYPNPVVKGQPVTVEMPFADAFVTMKNLSGQTILQTKNNVINTSDIQQGVYVVSVSDVAGNVSGRTKIIIQ